LDNGDEQPVSARNESNFSNSAPKTNQKFWEQVAESDAPPTIGAIYMAPGHLIRRCHQISTSIFANEFSEYDLTPVQYASLLAIQGHPGIDQRSLGNIVAFDRSTIATMLKGLERRELISRITPSDNLRIRQLYVSAKGCELLANTAVHISRVQQKILAPLSIEEQDQFMALLTKIVDINNEFSRVPLKLK